MKKTYLNKLNETELLINSLPWKDQSFYAQFLAQTYYFVCHSTRLLARSISHFGVDRDNLYRRFATHLKEENYHEKIAVLDLKALGYSPSDFEELSITKAFWESQYYKIDQSKGTSLLGYILYLEAIPVNCFKEVYGSFPDKASRFLKLHMEEDPKHLEEAMQMISGQKIEDQEQIWANYCKTAEIYQLMLVKIAEISKSIKNVA